MSKKSTQVCNMHTQNFNTSLCSSHVTYKHILVKSKSLFSITVLLTTSKAAWPTIPNIEQMQRNNTRSKDSKQQIVICNK